MSRTFAAFAFALVLAVALTGRASDRHPKPPQPERREGASTTTLPTTPPTTEQEPDDPGLGTLPPATSPNMASTGTGEACDGIAWVIPVALVWRESRCQRVGDTGGPYIGAYQITRSYWGPDEICAGLDWNDPAQEDECARRLWNDGAGAHHWGA